VGRLRTQCEIVRALAGLSKSPLSLLTPLVPWTEAPSMEDVRGTELANSRGYK
jgi:hypothetical protein